VFDVPCFDGEAPWRRPWHERRQVLESLGGLAWKGGVRSDVGRKEGEQMHVGVIHRIRDPEGFQAAESKAMEQGLPSSVALPIHSATPDHRVGVCIWEGESVEAVRDVVEAVVGPYSENEYFELEVDGLPATR
jgi:hypothetical protein